ncbi:MFS transporter [Catenulispora acidiphila]|uniref:MFS transporter n=1 Tax=Catenulispora acidiphila TaxID=304895 RepID=UPI00167FE2A9|nr:MFS transporter [Catenulispora acidiphila]
MTQVQPPPVRRLWSAVFFGYLALGATLQELPGYMTSKFGDGPTIIGVAVGIAYLGTAVTRPFAGRAGDAGLARNVSVAGGAITTLAALGQLTAPSALVLIIFRLLMGIGEGALFSGCLPWVLTGIAADRRGRIAGWFGLSMWGGLALGPLAAVGVNHLGGSTATWWTIFGLPLVSSVLIASTRPQPAVSPRREIRPQGWRDIVPIGVSVPGIVLGLAAYGYGTLNALLVLYLTHDHIGGQGIGLTVFAVAFLATRAAGSPLTDQYGGIRVARVTLVVEIAGLCVLAASSSQGGALAGCVVTGIGLGVIYPSTSKITLGRTGPLQAGVSMGTMTSFWDLGIMAAGPISGAVAAHLGYREGFGVAAAVTVAALVLTVLGLHTDSPAEAPTSVPRSVPAGAQVRPRA